MNKPSPEYIAESLAVALETLLNRNIPVISRDALPSDIRVVRNDVKMVAHSPKEVALILHHKYHRDVGCRWFSLASSDEGI